MATIYIVGTPIGNLEDITLRALRVLSEVDIIVCEDTRATKKLMARHSISKQTLSYHAQSGAGRTTEIINMLRDGKNLALVSDAGTPGISDPGAELVSKIRKELAEEIRSGSIKIEVVPGPSALTAALSISGVPCADFTFLGFLPHKKGRETLFKEIRSAERTIIFYESPHRINKTFDSLVDHLDGTNKRVTVCRELTKIFEEVVQGSAAEVREFFGKNPDKVRGEFVVMVSK